jgi:hypothetical protein
MRWIDLATGGYGRLVIYGLFAMAIAASYGYAYHLGSSRTAAAWSLKYEQREVDIKAATNAEISRQAQANAQAKAIEAKRLAALDADNAALETKIKELSDAANADPDRDRVCLSDGSGLRIDSIH